MRVQVRFQGRVQGVGFRATAVECARGLALTGFVRNEADGGVLLEVQGGEPDIQALLDRVHERMARNISRTDRTQVADRPGEHSFTIQR
jgi:acylphosphatase